MAYFSKHGLRLGVIFKNSREARRGWKRLEEARLVQERPEEARRGQRRPEESRGGQKRLGEVRPGVGGDSWPAAACASVAGPPSHLVALQSTPCSHLSNLKHFSEPRRYICILLKATRSEVMQMRQARISCRQPSP